MILQFKGTLCRSRKQSSLLLHKLPNARKNDQAGKQLRKRLLSSSPVIKVLIYF